MELWNVVVLLLGILVGLLGFLLRMHKERDDERIHRLECEIKRLRDRVEK